MPLRPLFVTAVAGRVWRVDYLAFTLILAALDVAMVLVPRYSDLKYQVPLELSVIDLL
jgi:hypothetical protein